MKTDDKIMIIMRGLPGSGKSTRARDFGGQVFSTDDFFVEDGVYRFDPKKIAINHAANQERVRAACIQGISPVVVDNTNTQKWEARPYVHLARLYGYLVRFVEADTPWARDAEALAARNVHGVTREGIERMLLHYEPHESFTEDAVLRSKAPWEHE